MRTKNRCPYCFRCSVSALPSSCSVICTAASSLLPQLQNSNWPRYTLTCKVLEHSRLLYLSHLHTYTSAHTLLSQDKHLLAVPTVSTVTGKCSLSYAAPSTWNEIPVKSHNSPSLVPFKKHLKTNITFPYCHHTIPP